MTRLHPSVLWAIPCVVVGFFTYLAREYQLDDSLIYLRYLRNLIEGNGLVFNPGEYFNGLTSPLYVFVLFLGSFVFQNLQLNTIIISGALLLAAAIVAGKLFSRSNWEAIFTAVLIGGFSIFYWNFGMESALFLCLIGLSLHLYSSDSDYFVLTLSLLALTRIEGIILAGFLGLDYLYRHKKLPNLKLMATAIVIFSLPFLFNYFYYGALVPATGSAKIGQGSSGLWGDGWLFLDTAHLVSLGFRGSMLAFLLTVAYACVGVWLLRHNRVATLALAFAVTLFLVYTLFNVPNYYWYYSPFFYLGLLFAAHGLWSMLASAWQKFKRARDSKALLTLISNTTAMTIIIAATMTFQERGPPLHYVTLGNWLAANTPEDSSVAMVEVGTVGWYSRREIVDILGLVSPHNAEHIGKREFFAWQQYYQPDYVLVHDPQWAHERSVSLLLETGAYTLDSEFNFRGFLLLTKSGLISDEQISQNARNAMIGERNLEELADSSSYPPDFVRLDAGRLFAHAPTELTLTLKQPEENLQIGYGLDTAIQGRHSGICFAVKKPLTDEVLFSDCIATDSAANDMNRAADIPFRGNVGDELLFSISCPVGCDYAWSYWNKVYFLSTADD